MYIIYEAFRREKHHHNRNSKNALPKISAAIHLRGIIFPKPLLYSIDQKDDTCFCVSTQVQPLGSQSPRRSAVEGTKWPHMRRSFVQSIPMLHIDTRLYSRRRISFAPAAKLHERRSRIDVFRPWLEVGCHVSCPGSPGRGASRAVEVGVRIGVRKVLSMLRSLVGIGVHICICSGSSGWKRGRICRGAASVCSVVIICGMVGEDLRRANGFIGVWSSNIQIPQGIGMSLAIHYAVRSGVSLVSIGLAGCSGHMRWSHCSADRIELIVGGNRKGLNSCREVMGKAA